MLIRRTTHNSIEVQLVNWIAGLVQCDCGILTELRSQGGSPQTPMTSWPWLR
jgi:hypothetical protein